jgi:hypothetical protein
MNEHLVAEQKRGRELLRAQKEQQRLISAGGARDDSVRKLTELREDLRVARERLRRGTEANEVKARHVAEAEARSSALALDLKPLEIQFATAMQQAATARKRVDVEAAEREATAARLEAQAERAAAVVEAEREKQLEQRVRAKAQGKGMRAEVNRLEEALTLMLNAKKRERPSPPRRPTHTHPSGFATRARAPPTRHHAWSHAWPPTHGPMVPMRHPRMVPWYPCATHAWSHGTHAWSSHAPRLATTRSPGVRRVAPHGTPPHTPHGTPACDARPTPRRRARPTHPWW